MIIIDIKYTLSQGEFLAIHNEAYIPYICVIVLHFKHTSNHKITLQVNLVAVLWMSFC